MLHASCLQDTQAYPAAYGTAVFQAWLACDAKEGPGIPDDESDSDAEFTPHDFHLAELSDIEGFTGVSSRLLHADFRQAL